MKLTCWATLTKLCFYLFRPSGLSSTGTHFPFRSNFEPPRAELWGPLKSEASKRGWREGVGDWQAPIAAKIVPQNCAHLLLLLREEQDKGCRKEKMLGTGRMSLCQPHPSANPFSKPLIKRLQFSHLVPHVWLFHPSLVASMSTKSLSAKLLPHLKVCGQWDKLAEK